MFVEYSSFTNLLAASGSLDTIGAILAIRIMGSLPERFSFKFSSCEILRIEIVFIYSRSWRDVFLNLDCVTCLTVLRPTCLHLSQDSLIVISSSIKLYH